MLAPEPAPPSPSHAPPQRPVPFSYTPQVEALALLLGAPAPPECVRAPAEMSVIQGCFWMAAGGGAALQQPLKEQGVPSRALPPVDMPSKLDIRREVGNQWPQTKHVRSK